MRVSKYNSGDDFASIQIDVKNSDRRIVFFTGIGQSMRKQGEPFIRRFALLNHISYLALDFDAITSDKSLKENFGLETVFDRAMEKISKLPEERLIFTGPCFGGLMAYRAAQEFPKKVENLVLTSPLLSMDSCLSSHIDSVLTKRSDRLKKAGLDKDLISRMDKFHRMVVMASDKYGRVAPESSYTGPIHIIHGDRDILVPYSNSFALQQALSRSNIGVQLVRGGKHNFDVASNNKMRFSISALKKHLGR